MPSIEFFPNHISNYANLKESGNLFRSQSSWGAAGYTFLYSHLGEMWNSFRNALDQNNSAFFSLNSLTWRSPQGTVVGKLTKRNSNLHIMSCQKKKAFFIFLLYFPIEWMKLLLWVVVPVMATQNDWKCNVTFLLPFFILSLDK